MTGLSLPAVFTLAVKIVYQISTHTSVSTRVHAAVINVGLAVLSFPPIGADTLVHADFINTGTAVAAGITFTVVDVLMAVGSSKSLLAFAAEMSTGVTAAATVRTTNIRGDKPHAARSTVGRHGDCAAVNHLTGCCKAVVLELGAVLSFIIFRTFTVIVRGQTKALRSVLTRAALAVVHIQLTQGT